ncbi:hypothetical protein M0805_004564 [Coniferiporia weirii]|nr:hypothetical protein M0805_004564 [Coniferiporia weirii]
MDIPSAKNTNRKHHAELYFNDGDIILSATSMQADASTSGPRTEVLFKIHKFQLAKNSDIFQSMLELPTPPDGVNEIYNGAPVVILVDTAKEIEDLLKMLYEPWEMKFRQYSPYTCISIRNALAMSTKYQFNRIRRCIVFHVEADWPRSLKGWDRFEARVEMVKKNTELFSITNDLPEPASALAIARLYDVKRILPAVYYDLSRLSVLDDWDDEKAKEAAIMQNTDGNTSLYVTRAVRWRLLSGEEFRILQRGKCAMRYYLAQLASKTPNAYDLFDEAKDCDSGKEGCEIAVSVEKLGIGTHHDPCEECTCGIIKFLKEARENIWSLLNTFFDPNFDVSC